MFWLMLENPGLPITMAGMVLGKTLVVPEESDIFKTIALETCETISLPRYVCFPFCNIYWTLKWCLSFWRVERNDNLQNDIKIY